VAAIRQIVTDRSDDLVRELESLNVDKGGIALMAPKAKLHLLRLRALQSPAANILKQELLSIGGDCATSSTVILGEEKSQDIMIMATQRQLQKLAPKLKAQPFGLKQVARQVDGFLKEQSRAPDHALLNLFVKEPGNLPLIMGILNVTKDSFSDGGKYNDEESAINHGLSLVKDGADIVDIGGESTRPGSDPLPADDEIRKVIPVIAGLREQTDRPISIDTTKAVVARAALDAGANLVNDVSAGRHDPDMLAAVAEAGCPYVMMHMQGLPRTMQDQPRYDHLMDELHRFFDERIDAAVQAGIKESNLIIDPGIGFGKRREDNFEILRRLKELTIFRRPILVGASRKSLLRNPLGETPRERLEETIAAHTIAMANGANIIRVHDIVPALKSRVVVQRLQGRA